MLNSRPFRARKASAVSTDQLHDLSIGPKGSKQSHDMRITAVPSHRPHLTGEASDDFRPFLPRHDSLSPQKDQHSPTSSVLHYHDSSQQPQVPDYIKDYKSRNDWLKDEAAEPIGKSKQRFHKYTIRAADLQTGNTNKIFQWLLARKSSMYCALFRSLPPSGTSRPSAPYRTSTQTSKATDWGTQFSPYT